MKSQPAKYRGQKIIALTLIGLALFFTVVLLLSSIRGISEQTHSYLGSLPLALAGVGYALLQIALRPARGTLLKRLLLAATFVGWAVDQVLPTGPVAIFIGDMVIAAYVLDLYWIAQDQTSVDHPPHSSVSKFHEMEAHLSHLENRSCVCHGEVGGSNRLCELCEKTEACSR